ncbi:MAG TPA: Gfo/Idh/MocA family oxidoreductase [Alphaproteobacteria bacterium]|nr:Gfo/Idh/MocA family oxidoreductase [Alphaproteobacteria bacterium]
MEPVRLALAGAGIIGRAHAGVIARDPGATLVAIADPAPAAADYARELGVAHFADVADMLDDAKPEGLVVASPNALHLPHALAAIERRIPALVEKPIADTLEAAASLVAASDAARVPVLVGHHRRHSPTIAAARDAVRAGRIGRVVSVAALCQYLKPDAYFDIAWRRAPGGGPVLINLIHDIDSLRHVVGEIASVQAATSNAVRGFPVEDTAALVLRFAEGAIGTVAITDAAAAPWNWEHDSGENPFYPHVAENCYYLAGTEGALALPRLDLWRYEGARGWTEPFARSRLEIVRADPLVVQMRHFCRVARGEEAPLVSAEDAARTLAATLAARRSAETGARIDL